MLDYSSESEKAPRKRKLSHSDGESDNSQFNPRKHLKTKNHSKEGTSDDGELSDEDKEEMRTTPKGCIDIFETTEVDVGNSANDEEEEEQLEGNHENTGIEEPWFEEMVEFNETTEVEGTGFGDKSDDNSPEEEEEEEEEEHKNISKENLFHVTETENSSLSMDSEEEEEEEGGESFDTLTDQQNITKRRTPLPLQSTDSNDFQPVFIKPRAVDVRKVTLQEKTFTVVSAQGTSNDRAVSLPAASIKMPSSDRKNSKKSFSSEVNLKTPQPSKHPMASEFSQLRTNTSSCVSSENNDDHGQIEQVEQNRFKKEQNHNNSQVNVFLVFIAFLVLLVGFISLSTGSNKVVVTTYTSEAPLSKLMRYASIPQTSQPDLEETVVDLRREISLLREQMNKMRGTDKIDSRNPGRTQQQQQNQHQNQPKVDISPTAPSSVSLDRLTMGMNRFQQFEEEQEEDSEDYSFQGDFHARLRQAEKEQEEEEEREKKREKERINIS